jgi:hypothetical protein
VFPLILSESSATLTYGENPASAVAIQPADGPSLNILPPYQNAWVPRVPGFGTRDSTNLATRLSVLSLLSATLTYGENPVSAVAIQPQSRCLLVVHPRGVGPC